MTRLLDRPVRAKPAYFGPDGAPPGIALKLDAYDTLNDGTKWRASRPKITPNTIVGHTNGASVEATVASSIRWGLASTNNTKPHYCLGDKPTKTLATNLRGIANSTGSSVEAQYGVEDSSFWSIAVETADIGGNDAKARGINWPTDCGPFLYDNADDFAHIIAYEAIVWGFPIRVPASFPAGGVVAHTWPWPYPHFTTVPGKTCPGTTKIAVIRDEIIPRAQQIRAVWTSPTPQPDQPAHEDDDMPGPEFILKPPAGSPANWPFLYARDASVRPAIGEDVEYAKANDVPIISNTADHSTRYRNLHVAAMQGREPGA